MLTTLHCSCVVWDLLLNILLGVAAKFKDSGDKSKSLNLSSARFALAAVQTLMLSEVDTEHVAWPTWMTR